MKLIIIKLFLLAYLLFSFGNTYGQLNISDYFNDFIMYDNEENMLLPPNCSHSHEDYLTKYGTQAYNIPSLDNPVVKTIKVNFNIMQKDDSSGNFSQIDTNNLKQIFEWFANYYITNDTPSDPLPGVVFIPDTYIRFELSGIYFYKNSLL